MKLSSCSFAQSLWVFFASILLSRCDDEFDLTFEIGPAKKECFYQEITKNTPFEVDVQVIEGGELDISLTVVSPTGNVLVLVHKKTESYHPLNSGDIEGVYTFCVDNTFSRFSPKVVNLQIIVDSPEGESENDNINVDYDVEGLFGTKMQDIKDTIHLTSSRLEKCLQTLNYLKTVEARDRSIAESNFERVNFWSVVHMVVLLSAAITQVLMIRSLFEEKSRFPKILK